ncbi:hypothetical protein C7271_04990 [filamentous cyanobacterium CCP5]|nr:hypothetical protein C7271_04990 [filamentous cyanobacterium CCP5]
MQTIPSIAARLKRQLAWIMLGILGSTAFAIATAPGSAQTYSDLDGHWAQPCIQQLAAANIVSGYPDGSFRPNQGVTRAEYGALINQAFPTIEAVRGRANFQDVASDYWANDAIQTAYQKGFLSGYPNREFRPDALINRTEAFVAMASGLNFAPPSNSAMVLQNTFIDAPAIPTYGVAAIAAGVAKGVVIAPDQMDMAALMNPMHPATRAQIAAAICQVKLTEPGVSDSYVVNGGGLADSEIGFRLGPICTNSEAGYSVRYPTGWMTNSGDVTPPCRYFDPDSLTIPEQSSTFDEAISLRQDSLPYNRLTDSEDITQTVISRRNMTIQGRPATITEAETTGRGILPGGIRTYRYIVDLERGILVGSTYDMEGQQYRRNKQVLDWMMRTLKLTI